MNKLAFNKEVYDYAKYVESWVIDNIYEHYTLESIKLDWSPSRRSHRGGFYAKGPGINLAMKLLRDSPEGVPIRFYEYKSYDADKTIGGFYSYNSKFYNQAIVLHEIAHSVQFYTYKLYNTRCKPHGPMFKGYYKQLREALLNPLLPDQQSCKQDYDAYIKDIQNHNYNTLKKFLEG